MPKFELNIAGQKQVIDVEESAVSVSVPLSVTITPILPPKPQFLNLLDYGAVPDGRTDCQNAIARALTDARNRKLPLYVPPGKYLHSAIVTIDSVAVFGDGDKSEFVSNNPANAAIFLRGTGPSLAKVQHTINVNGMPRQSAAEQASVCVWQASEALVENVRIEGGTSIGVLVYGSRAVTVRGCSVRRTLADSYHVTFGSSNVEISNNFARECGDDGVAVVSYGRNPAICSRVNIIGNDVGHNTWGRGITVVGGQEIRIEGNTVTKSHGAGILIASEGNPWNTFGVNGVTCIKNSCFDCVTSPTIGHPSVLVTGRMGFLVSNVLLDAITVVNPRNDAFRFDQFLDRISVRGASISGLRVGFKTFNIHPESVSKVSIQ